MDHCIYDEELARGCDELVDAFIECAHYCMRVDHVLEVESAWRDEHGDLPAWIVRWHRLWIEDPERAWRQWDDWLVRSLSNSIIFGPYSYDAIRLAWVVSAYRFSRVASDLDRAGEWHLPEVAGMDSANAIGTIATYWEWEGDRPAPPPRKPRSDQETDPVAAGRRWLTRLRKRLGKLVSSGAILSEEEDAMVALLHYLPTGPGRPEGTSSRV